MAGDGEPLVRRGFTLIEILTAIVLIALIMIPVSLVLLEQVRTAGRADTESKALEYARRELAIVNQTAFASLATRTDTQSVFDIVRTVTGTTSPKSVVIEVRPHGSTEKLVTLNTTATDRLFGAGSGSLAYSGNQGSVFTASGGTLSRTDLKHVDVTNTTTEGSIKMTGVKMTFYDTTGLPTTKNLTSIAMNGSDTYHPATPLSIPSTTPVPFESNFVMAADTTYNNAGEFIFAENLPKNYTLTIQFGFSDDTWSIIYTWNR